MVRKTLSRPVLTDGWLHAAFAIKYLIFAAFGIIGALSSVPAIAEVAGALYEFAWATSIAIVNLMTVVLIFRNIRTGYLREKPVKYEWYLTFLIVGLVATYSIALLTLAFGDSDSRNSVAIISFALLIFPIWRIRYLYRILRGK